MKSARRLGEEISSLFSTVGAPGLDELGVIVERDRREQRADALREAALTVTKLSVLRPGYASLVGHLLAMAEREEHGK